MILPADTPRAWLDSHYAAWFEYHDPAVEHRRASLDDLLGGGLRELHERLTAEGTPRKAAAKYLADWFGGLVARSIGFASVAAGAGLLADRDALRWHIHPDGWAARVELGDPVALVAPGHPWSGRPGTETVAGEAERHARTVAALADALRPLVEALRPLSGLGLPGLWAEVGDGFGGVLAYQSSLPVRPEGIATLRALATAGTAPWKAHPSLWPVDTERGPVCVMHKGGCCLAYTEPAPDEEPDDEESRLFRERFGDDGAPRYCSHCSLRDAESCEAQQIWYAARVDASKATN